MTERSAPAAVVVALPAGSLTEKVPLGAIVTAPWPLATTVMVRVEPEPPAPAKDTPEYAEWFARREMPRYGWTADQMRCLRPMWIGESHWQYREITGKYIGIPQTTIGVANDYGFTEAQYRGIPEVQVEVGLRYIRDRYGSPCKAWSFWKAQGAWQDSADPEQWWGGWY